MLDYIKQIFARPPSERKITPRIYSDSELSEFEKKWGVELPHAYRGHLQTVGVGDFKSRKVDLLEEWDPLYDDTRLAEDFLIRSFPHIAAWNDLSLHSKPPSWIAPYFSADLVCGSMRVFSTGCEGHHILVVSGPERGNVWHDDRVCFGTGIYPLKSRSGQRLSMQEYLERGTSFDRTNLQFQGA
jgi:hypothetical protein